MGTVGLHLYKQKNSRHTRDTKRGTVSRLIHHVFRAEGLPVRGQTERSRQRNEADIQVLQDVRHAVLPKVVEALQNAAERYSHEFICDNGGSAVQRADASYEQPRDEQSGTASYGKFWNGDDKSVGLLQIVFDA